MLPGPGLSLCWPRKQGAPPPRPPPRHVCAHSGHTRPHAFLFASHPPCPPSSPRPGRRLAGPAGEQACPQGPMHPSRCPPGTALASWPSPATACALPISLLLLCESGWAVLKQALGQLCFWASGTSGQAEETSYPHPSRWALRNSGSAFGPKPWLAVRPSLPAEVLGAVCPQAS